MHVSLFILFLLLSHKNTWMHLNFWSNLYFLSSVPVHRALLSILVHKIQSLKIITTLFVLTPMLLQEYQQFALIISFLVQKWTVSKMHPLTIINPILHSWTMPQLSSHNKQGESPPKALSRILHQCQCHLFPEDQLKFTLMWMMALKHFTSSARPTSTSNNPITTDSDQVVLIVQCGFIIIIFYTFWTDYYNWDGNIGCTSSCCLKHRGATLEFQDMILYLTNNKFIVSSSMYLTPCSQCFTML